MKFEGYILVVTFFQLLSGSTTTVVPSESPYQALDRASANVKYNGQANRGISMTIIIRNQFTPTSFDVCIELIHSWYSPKLQLLLSDFFFFIAIRRYKMLQTQCHIFFRAIGSQICCINA